MAQRNTRTSDHSLQKRIGNLENLLSQLLQERNNLPCTSPTEESKNNSQDKTSRKRSASLDENEGSKKKRSEGAIFECTLCDAIFQKEWTLFRHYKLIHAKKSPERVHYENLTKNASTKNKTVKDTVVTVKSGKDNNCKLCEATFNSTSVRNSHYRFKHQIIEERFLFFPNGTALIESSLEQQVSENPEWFRTFVKRNMPARVCKLCKMELDLDVLKYHYEKDHKVFQTSKLKDLIRLSYNDFKHMPTFQKCQYCSADFDDAEALGNHVATVHADLFVDCKICNKTFEKKIYNDHVKNMHQDVRQEKVCVVNIAPIKVPETIKITTKKQETRVNKESDKQKVEITDVRHVSFQHRPTQDVPLMYICDTCNLVTSSYDNVISHSQDHILNNETKTPKICEICDLKFDTDYPVHEQMHASNDDLDRDSFRFVSYDYKNLTNDKWLDMFRAFAKSKVSKIISASIYVSTRCIRLKLLKDCKDASIQFTLYQCLACTNYVHPSSLEVHVGLTNACTNQTFNYQCEKCSKSFFTTEARDEHTQSHSLPDSDSRYRTVLFNDPSDFDFNKALLQKAGKKVFVEKEVVNRSPSDYKINDRNVAAQKPVSKTADMTNQSNDINTKNHGETTVTDHEKKVTDGGNVNKNIQNRVTDKSSGVENEEKVPSKTKPEKGKVADIYKCACGLCFDRYKSLLMHMQKCTNDITHIVKITCPCGLVFDTNNFDYHCEVHRDNIAIFNVKRLILVDETLVDVKGMSEEFKKYFKRQSVQSNKVNLNEHVKVKEQIKSTNELVALNVTSQKNILIQANNISKDVNMSIDVNEEVVEANVRKAGSKNGTTDEVSNSAAFETRAEIAGKENLKKGESGHRKQTVVLNDIPKTKQAEVTPLNNLIDNKTTTSQQSESTQENEILIQTTMEEELKNCANEQKSKKYIEEQPELVKNGNQETNEKFQSVAPDFDEDIREENVNANIPVQNSEKTDREINCDDNADDRVHIVNGYQVNHLNRSDTDKFDSNHDGFENQNNMIIETGIETQVQKKIVNDDTEIDDYDEEELLKDVDEGEDNDEVNDSLISDDEEPVGLGIGLIKKKIGTFITSFSSKKN